MPAATVVIATRNRAALLSDCLNHLGSQTARGTFEVVVVDNGSTDDTATVVHRHMAAMPELRLLHVEDPNRSKARNAGIAAAQGSWLIFCDDDTVAPPQFVAAHLAAHERHEPRVVTGPIVNVANALALAAPAARHYSRAYFCTCNASVSKAAVDSVGGFDEQYDLYGWEDTDLGLRLRAKGLRRIFDWQAYIFHIKPPAADAFARRQALAIEKGTMAARFVRKSPTWPVKLATGAYAANFLRADLMTWAPLRRLYERAIRSADNNSALKTFAAEALIDAAYVNALKAALRSAHE